MRSLQHAHGVLEWVLDAPQRRNPLSAAVLDALAEVARAAATQHDLRAVVLSAEGPVFSAGADLRELRAALDAPAGAEAFRAHGMAALRALEELPVPLLCALRGSAYGGGAELALACDLRFMAPDAQLELRHVRMGLVPVWGSLARLRRLLPYPVAAELLLAAAPLDAGRAELLGVARRADDPRAAALAHAQRVAEASPAAVRAAKRLLRAQYHAVDADADGAELGGLFGDSDMRDAVARFFA